MLSERGEIDGQSSMAFLWKIVERWWRWRDEAYCSKFGLFILASWGFMKWTRGSKETCRCWNSSLSCARASMCRLISLSSLRMFRFISSDDTMGWSIGGMLSDLLWNWVSQWMLFEFCFNKLHFVIKVASIELLVLIRFGLLGRKKFQST